MTEKKKSTNRTGRTKLQDLPTSEKELSKKEKHQVKGGATRIIPGGIRSTSGNASSGGGSETDATITVEAS